MDLEVWAPAKVRTLAVLVESFSPEVGGMSILPSFLSCAIARSGGREHGGFSHLLASLPGDGGLS